MALNTRYLLGRENRRVARFVDCMTRNYQRRSLVAIRYVAQAARSVCVTCGVG
jgi:hypothetical protein